ncbi:MAG: PilZ domain-containing protein [Bryobacterales bacterium]|nr:PilZ domain-containing protein [Bryobacterales bacterium]
MVNRRKDLRLLCADLLDVHWRDKTGRSRKAVANLEDISIHGSCLQLDVPLPVTTRVVIRYPKGELAGVVKYCHYREIGYFVGVQFEPGSKWSRTRFKPLHMLDPTSLLPAGSANRATGAANGNSGQVCQGPPDAGI